jgi:2-polyprenyl-3-methyl-5-hydroxy-6-metoxy-1,4-benzoquinol methylase
MADQNTLQNRTIKDKIGEKKLFSSSSAPWQQIIIKDFLRRLFNEKDNLKVLDAASGVGNNIQSLASYAQKIVCIDRSIEAIDLSKDINYKFEDILEYKVSTLENIQSEDSIFDLVICTEALEHVADINLVIGELKRVTKSDGYIIISFQNYNNLMYFFKPVYEFIFKKNFDAWGTHGYDEGFESNLRIGQVEKIIRDLRLKIIETRGADYLNAWLSWLPFVYRNYAVLDKYPFLSLGKIPLIKRVGMDYFMVLQK